MYTHVPDDPGVPGYLTSRYFQIFKQPPPRWGRSLDVQDLVVRQSLAVRVAG
jgi:hypothetical protein